MTLATKEIVDPDYGLFKLSKNNKSLYPSPDAILVDDYLEKYRLFGRIIAKVP